MEIEVRCLTCPKVWKQVVKEELRFAKVIALDWCLTCKQKQHKEFERQFVLKLIPKEAK